MLTAATLVIRRTTIFDKTSICRSSRSLIRTFPKVLSPTLSKARDWQDTTRSDIPALPDQDHFDLAATSNVAAM
jgi:hypothetical protein